MSQENQLPEVWMRGPVDGVPPLLQPLTHVLLQVAEDARKYTEHLAAFHAAEHAQRHLGQLLVTTRILQL